MCLCVSLGAAAATLSQQAKGPAGTPGGSIKPSKRAAAFCCVNERENKRGGSKRENLSRFGEKGGFPCPANNRLRSSIMIR